MCHVTYTYLITIYAKTIVYFHKWNHSRYNFNIPYESRSYTDILLWVQLQPYHKLWLLREDEVQLITTSHIRGEERSNSTTRPKLLYQSQNTEENSRVGEMNCPKKHRYIRWTRTCTYYALYEKSARIEQTEPQTWDKSVI